MKFDVRPLSLLLSAAFCAALTLPAPAQVGPDIVIGRLFELDQLDREGPVGSGTVALGMWTTMCNRGDRTVPVRELPSVDHPVIIQNAYRLSTTDGSARLEQIGQAWLKHTFGSSNEDLCGFGCGGGSPSELPPGCSDTYASIQLDPCGLGTNGIMAPRSVLHPYYGTFPGGPELGPGGGCPVNFPAANHIGHHHQLSADGFTIAGISHRLQVRDVDLMPALNVGSRYFAEGQYVSSIEFTEGNGNQFNNVSHREVGVEGPDASGVFLFPNLSDTVSESPALDEWVGATQTILEPAPLADGRGILACEVTDLGSGLWHYEYAVYNMNNDASFGSLGIPLPAGVTVSNIGFHAPLNHAPEANADNYDNEPWTTTIANGMITFATDAFDIDPLANAVRFATLYNFRFDADSPPQGVFATVGLYKLSTTLRAAAAGPRAPAQTDCNNNGIDDTCELDCAAPGCSGVAGCGTATDCDGSGVPDECEIDCNGNKIDDRCDIASGFSADCTGNGVPDECEPDCDQDGLPDSCEMLNGTGKDCNGDGILDNCLLPGGVNPDQNGNGVLDACECLPPTIPAAQQTVVAKNRYLTIYGTIGTVSAVQVTFKTMPPPFTNLEGSTFWVNSPSETSENAGVIDPAADTIGLPTFFAASLACDPTDIFWRGFDRIDVFHPGIVPGATYEIRAFSSDCPITFTRIPSAPVAIATSPWGDVVEDCSTTPCGPPDGTVDVVTDVTSILDKFKNLPTAPRKARCDLEPRTPDLKINISDVTFGIDAFGSEDYPFSGPRPCAGAD